MKFLTTAIILTASVTLRSRALAALLLFSLIGGTVWAQVTASIVGTVKDMSGGVLPGAQVTVKHTETGLTRTAGPEDWITVNCGTLSNGGQNATWRCIVRSPGWAIALSRPSIRSTPAGPRRPPSCATP